MGDLQLADARLPASAGAVLDAALARAPEREALVAADGRMTYAQLDAAADRAAAALYELGARHGDVVATSLPNLTDAVVTFHAVMRLGAIWLGINRNLAPPEMRFILQDAGADVLLADAGVAAALGEDAVVQGVRVLPVGPKSEWEETVASANADYARPLPHPSDPAGIAYTSGTTGRPKGVVHSHENVLLPGAVLVAERGFGPHLRKGDCAALTILNMQITTTLLVAQARGTQIVMDRSDPAGVAGWIRRERVTSWFGVPTLLHGLVENDEVSEADLASLDDLWSGGTYVPDAIRVAFESRFGKRIHATYGLTEAPTVVTIEPRDQPHVPGSSGRALPHVVAEVRDEIGAVLPAGEIGEITVRARDVGDWRDTYRPMLEYLGQPVASAAAVRAGVLYTGDVGEFDADGNLRVHDRRSSLILRGGANVYPAEVERVLLEIPTVTGAAVVGVADERLGARVGAAVELAPGASTDVEALAAHCGRHLARYKVPELWHIGALPRNAMGKVNRADISPWFAD
jgi:long-chain acyl-CoA synthetase